MPHTIFASNPYRSRTISKANFEWNPMEFDTNCPMENNEIKVDQGLNQLGRVAVSPSELISIMDNLQNGYRLNIEEAPELTICLFKDQEHTKDWIRDYNQWREARCDTTS